jgi:hypothetical protein
MTGKTGPQSNPEISPKDSQGRNGGLACRGVASRTHIAFVCGLHSIYCSVKEIHFYRRARKWSSTPVRVPAPVSSSFRLIRRRVDSCSLASGEVEKVVNSKESIRQFLQGIYGARGSKGETIFSPEKGILFDNIPKVGKTKLMTDKVSWPLTHKSPCSDSAMQELDYYTEEYARTGIHGPCKFASSYTTNTSDW